MTTPVCGERKVISCAPSVREGCGTAVTVNRATPPLRPRADAPSFSIDPMAFVRKLSERGVVAGGRGNGSAIKANAALVSTRT